MKLFWIIILVFFYSIFQKKGYLADPVLQKKKLFLYHMYYQKVKIMCFFFLEKGPTNYRVVGFCNRNRYAEANYELIRTSSFNILFHSYSHTYIIGHGY